VAMHTALPRNTPALLFALWATAAGSVAVLRPGQLLEIAMVGIVGMVAWRTILEKKPPRHILLWSLCLLVPLTNTWPARIYQSVADQMPVPVPALLSLVSLSALAGIAVTRPRRLHAPALLLGGWALLLIGGFIAAFASERSLFSLGDLWVTVFAPAAFAATMTSITPGAEDRWQVLSLIVIAALVPLTMAIAAYALSFGVPLSGEELVKAKMLLFRPHLLQEVTFGNISQVAALILLVLPAAVFIGARPGFDRTLRTFAMLTAAAAILVLMLVQVRSALLVADLTLIAVTLIFFSRRDLRTAAVPLVGVAALTLIALSPAVRATYTNLVPTFSVARDASPAPSTPVPTAQSGSPAATASTSFRPTRSPTIVLGPITVVASDHSEELRVEALRKGTAVFADHMPWGVGSGQYGTYDPAHTASHSLLIQTLVEDGLLGAVGLTLVCLFVLVGIARQFRRRGYSRDQSDLRWACLLGCGAFLLQGLVAGAPLAIAPIAVWASVLWLLLWLTSSPTSGPRPP
jgi:hypothetical protein